MMGDPKSVRDKWLHIRLNEREYETIMAYWQQTTSIKRSDYVRRVLLQKPVRVLYRNQSTDELLEQLLQLKAKLEKLENYFHETTQYLQNCPDTPEVKIGLAMHQKMEQPL